MATFQYHVMVAEVIYTTPPGPGLRPKWRDRLNDYSAKGWEAVQLVTPTQGWLAILLRMPEAGATARYRHQVMVARVDDQKELGPGFSPKERDKLNDYGGEGWETVHMVAPLEDWLAILLKKTED